MNYYQPDTLTFLDGNWIKAAEAKGSLYDQTLHYGYGAFDGLRSYKNAEGCNIFKATEHFQRLIKSANRLNIRVPYSAEDMTHIAYQLLKKNNLLTAYIRPLIFLGPNMELTNDTTSHFFMAAWPWKKYLGYDPIDIMVSKYRKPSDHTAPFNAKLVGNYMNSILASSQAKQSGYHEALMLDVDGFVAEGAAANFFYEKDQVLYTPHTRHALPGITRATIIDLAKQWGIKVIEKDISLEEVYQADYAFLTGTATEVTPIGTIDGERLKGNWEDSHGYNLYLMYRRLVMHNEFMDLTIV